MAGENVSLGANLVSGGATFRVWAPAAHRVVVRGNFDGWAWHDLANDGRGYWFAFVPGVSEGDQYKYFVAGAGSQNHKRDPYGRSRTWDPAYPSCNNFITRPGTFPWHDASYRPPGFHQLNLYQLHVGAFHAADAAGHDIRPHRPGRFLDVLDRLEYLVDLGVNAVQLLPIQEFETMRSLGYNGTDFFAPELDYTIVPTDHEFDRYFRRANDLLARKGLAPYRPGDLDCQTKQLMALVDVCHVYGVAVVFDLVYNHAGGGLDDESLRFFDCLPYGDDNRSQYFTDKGWAGGMIFAYWRREVCQFLIDNAGFFFDEYHVDGYRFDEVTVVDDHGGWNFLRDLTATLQHKKPSALLIAEYWADQSAVLRGRGDGGAGFDAVVEASLRHALRGVVAQATGGASAAVNLDPLAAALYPKHGPAWRSVVHLENHDVVRVNNETDRVPRIGAVGDTGNPRSWYARSRARWANALLLTAPGIPMLFMGQELGEDKFWSDSPDYYRDSLIWWDGLDRDPAVQGMHRMVRELLWLRRRLPALQSDGFEVTHVRNDNRVLALQRWVPGVGRTVLIVANLREETWWGYEVGFPRAGRWREAFNSDAFESVDNPHPHGNAGQVFANGPPRDRLPCSASIVIPANGVIVFEFAD